MKRYNLKTVPILEVPNGGVFIANNAIIHNGDGIGVYVKDDCILVGAMYCDINDTSKHCGWCFGYEPVAFTGITLPLK